MTKDNIINFPVSSKEAEESYFHNTLPTSPDLAYFTNDLINDTYSPLALRTYQDRQESNDSTWLDYVPVLLGVPAYVDTVMQLDAAELPTLEVPLGLLTDLAFITNVSFHVAIEWQDEEDLLHLMHINFEEFQKMARVKDNALNERFSNSEIHDRKQFIISIFLDQDREERKETLLNVILAEGCKRLTDLNIIELFSWAAERFDTENSFVNFADFYNSVISIVDLHPVDLLHDKRIIYANDIVARTSNQDLLIAIEGEANEL